MIDSDGCFSLFRRGLRPPKQRESSVAAADPGSYYYSPALSVANQQRTLLEALRRQFGGKILNNHTALQRRRPCWVWRVTNRRGLEALVEHCRHLPSVGPKGHRLSLLPEFYQLREQGAGNPSSPMHLQWLELLKLFRG
jgi:hypothetical protein